MIKDKISRKRAKMTYICPVCHATFQSDRMAAMHAVNFKHHGNYHH